MHAGAERKPCPTAATIGVLAVFRPQHTMLAALLATLLLAAASALPTATVVPGCYDDNGAQVDYWLAIKLPSSFHVCHSAE